jgi:pyrroline-5-carboxylate reductase
VSTIVFVGGGRITSALLAGLQLAKTPLKRGFVVYDRNPGKLRDLKKLYEVSFAADLQDAAAIADVLVIAVRPDGVRDVLRDIGVIQRPVLAVSVAAGIPLRVLNKALGPPVRWARAMPSPVSRIGRGLTALTFPAGSLPADRKRVRDFFQNVGQVVEIPEKQFDAFSVTYSSSHGYHALATLAEGAQNAGLDRDTAILASAHALADGIIAWREGNHSLDWLLKEAATPGGIAAATIKGMDSAGYGRAVRNGIRDGMRRASALGKAK